MSAPVLTTASTILCPHGGQATLFSSNAEARIDGAPALLLTDQHPVAGCPFTVGPKAQPCIVIRWLVGATMTRVRGVPVVLRTSVGLCFSAEQIPQGAPVVAACQARAMGV